MIKYIYKLVLTLSIAFPFVSCLEDRSIGDVNEINEIVIEGMQKSYQVMLYDTLRIVPEISTTLSDDNKLLSYVWYLTTPTSRDKSDTLSRDKDLNIVFEADIVNPGEEFTLVYKVTDLESGVYYKKEAEFDLMTKFSKGTLILCEQDNESFLHFVSKTSVDKPELLRNCYRDANDQISLGEKPQAIFSLNPNDYKPQMREVLISCNDSRGGAFLNPNTFRDHRTMEESIFFQDSKPLVVTDYFGHGMIDYVIVNGQLCKRGVNMGNMTWEPPMVSVDGNNLYEAVGPSMNIANTLHVYDQKNGRLLSHERWNMGSLKKIGSTENDITHFDINNLGAHMKYVVGGPCSRENYFWLLLYNQQTSSHWVYVFHMKITGDSWNPIKTFMSKAKVEINSTNVPNHQDVLKHTCLNNFNSQIFYATKDHVYTINIVLNVVEDEDTNSEVVTIELEEVDLINATEKNFEVTGMEMGEFVVETLVDGTIMKERQNQVRLYIKDLALAGTQGGFAIYKVTNVGGMQANYDYHWSGFCDRVIDLDEKYN